VAPAALSVKQSPRTAAGRRTCRAGSRVHRRRRLRRSRLPDRSRPVETASALKQWRHEAGRPLATPATQALRSVHGCGRRSSMPASSMPRCRPAGRSPVTVRLARGVRRAASPGSRRASRRLLAVADACGLRRHRTDNRRIACTACHRVRAEQREAADDAPTDPLKSPCQGGLREGCRRRATDRTVISPFAQSVVIAFPAGRWRSRSDRSTAGHRRQRVGGDGECHV